MVAITGTIGTRRAGSWAWGLTALAVTLLLSGALLVVGAAPASAHENMLASSVPPASATLAEPPRRVMLTFRWPIRPDSATVTVVGPDGATQWQSGQAEVTDRSIHVGLRPLKPAGPYQVRYQGVSEWGRPFQGKVSFTLAPPVAAAPAPRTPDGPVRADGSGLPLGWVAGVVLLTAAAAAVGIRLGRTLP